MINTTPIQLASSGSSFGAVADVVNATTKQLTDIKPCVDALLLHRWMIIQPGSIRHDP